MIAPKIETLRTNRRIIAISDIHGHAGYLRGLLDKVGFCKKDVLIIVGDVIERGRESLEALRLVMALSETHRVYPLMGNVDLWRLECLDDDSPESDREHVDYIKDRREIYGGSLPEDMCAELGLTVETADDMKRARPLLRAAFQKELEFFRGFSTAVDAGKYFFVHGGLPTEDFTRLSEYDRSCFLKVDNFMGRGLSFDRYVVVGHWPVMLYGDEVFQNNPIVNEAQKIISIDGGCGIKRDGQLNAMILSPQGEISFAQYDDFKIVEALDAQEETPASVSITWVNGEVMILEEKADFAKVRHVASGQVVTVPASFIRPFEGRFICADYNDYRPQIRPGDCFSVVLTLEGASLIKKDGVTGWYFGRIKEKDLQG